MKNKIYSHLPAIIFGALVISFLAAFYIFAWTEPSVAPPGGNVPAPLNTGSEGQAKIGGLILNTGGFPTGLIVDQGNVGIGTTSPSSGTGGQLKLDVEGNVGADKYCDKDGNNCVTSSGLGATYDSGWFYVDSNPPGAQTYTKTHNLGTQNIIVEILFARDSGGTPDLNSVYKVDLMEQAGHREGAVIKGITNTDLTVFIPGDSLIALFGGGLWRIGWYKVLAIAI